jgi:predicted outer membrane repeat protein
MTFFRWPTALNPVSKTSARDRRRGPRAQRTRLRPWADLLEDRVVLANFTVPTPAYPNLPDAITAANSNKNLSNTIYLDYAITPSAPISMPPQTIQPTTSGATLAIINEGAPVAFTTTGSGPIVTIGSKSGTVAIIGQYKGQSHAVTLEGGSNTTGNGGAIDDMSPEQRFRSPKGHSRIDSQSLSLTNVAFAGNQALNGGAIYAASNTGAVTLTHCSFGPDPLANLSSNSAGGVGGAVDYEGSSTLTINDTTFISNEAFGGAGGAIYYNGAGNLTIGGNSAFIANTASNIPPEFVAANSDSDSAAGGASSAAGGAIYQSATHSPSIKIDDTSFLNNTAEGDWVSSSVNASGGAIATLGASLTITHSDFTGNQAVGSDWNGPEIFGSSSDGGPGGNADGGAIYYTAARPLNISSNVSFLNNAALGGNGGSGGNGGNGGDGGNARGGAVEDVGSGTGHVVASFYVNRAVGGNGGGLYFYPFMRNCGPFDATGAGGMEGTGGEAIGGGMYADDSQAEVSNSQFSLNTATGGGGGGDTLVGAGGSYGGGLANMGTLDLFNDAFRSNTATGGAGSQPNGNANYGSGIGGGVFNGGTAASLTATHDTFTDNTVQGIVGGGGGLANNSGHVNASYLTFDGNSAGAAGYGGAISTYLGSFTLSNSTGTGDSGQTNYPSGTLSPPGLTPGIYDSTGGDGTPGVTLKNDAVD